MPAWMTLLDRAKLNADDMVRPILDDTELALPEITSLMSEDVPGQEFKSLVYKTPLSMRYKKHGVGIDPVKSTPELQRFECHYLPGLIEIPESIADGATGGAARALANEMKRVLSAAFAHACRCLYYGTSIDADAPPGLLEVVLSSKVINASGTTGTTSVIAVRSGDSDVSWIFGNGGRIQAGDPQYGTLIDGNGKKLPGWMQWMKGYIGHCIRSPRSVAVINNVDATHPVTDQMLLDLHGKFKNSAPPTHIFMTKAAAISYGKSRITDYNKDAQVPEFFGGIPGTKIPILITDALDLDEEDGTTAAELEAQTGGASFVAP